MGVKFILHCIKGSDYLTIGFAATFLDPETWSCPIEKQPLQKYHQFSQANAPQHKSALTSDQPHISDSMHFQQSPLPSISA